MYTIAIFNVSSLLYIMRVLLLLRACVVLNVILNDGVLLFTPLLFMGHFKLIC